VTLFVSGAFLTGCAFACRWWCCLYVEANDAPKIVIQCAGRSWQF